MPQRMWTLLIAVLLTVGAADVDAQPAGQPPAGAAQPADAGQPAEKPESPLLVEPQTAEELFDAAVLVHKLGRPKLAKHYLEQMVAAGVDEKLLLTLRDKHGPSAFLRLSRDRELHPVSQELLRAMNEAFRKDAQSAARIDSLIADLAVPGKRENAVIILRNLGPIVVPRMLAHLADPAKAALHDDIRSTLPRLGRQVVPPLTAALDSPSSSVQQGATQALGLLADGSETARLLHAAFSPDSLPGVRVSAREALERIAERDETFIVPRSAADAAEALRERAKVHFSGQYPWETEDATIRLWLWDEGSSNVAAMRVEPETASAYLAEVYAGQAVDLAPADRSTQALYVAAALAYAMHRSTDGSLPAGPGTAYNLALTAGSDVVLEALRRSMSATNTAGAVAALDVLSQIGSREQLRTGRGLLSPVLAALNYPSRRVQFAAASTILQLDPQREFAGSGRVVDILAATLNDTAAPRALVVHSNVQRATTLGGLLAGTGFEPLVARTGQEAFKIAASRRDVELILLPLNTIRWPLSQTIANLRADARTAMIPIVVYGPREMQDRAAHVVSHYPLVSLATESVTAEHLQLQIRPLLERVQAPKLNAEQRAAQRTAAGYWLAHIAGGGRTKLFDLTRAESALIAAVDDPQLAPNALRALAAVPTAAAQERMQSAAVNRQADSNIRETAALQLAFHIQKFGLLLSDKRVVELKTTWESTTDAGLSTALASVMGSLKPNAALAARRLQSFPPPELPKGEREQ